MCSAGTRDCFDGSEFYCGTPELVVPEPEVILGGPTTITCDDGSEVMCSAGTFGCFDGSELYCGSAEATVVGLTEEQALADADAMEGTTVTEITTTTTTTEGATSVGLTEEQALADADEAEGTEITDLEAMIMGQFFDTPMTIT